MGYFRKILLFVISVAMVVCGLSMIGFELFVPGAGRAGVAGHAAIDCGRGDTGVLRTVFVVGGFHCADLPPSLI
jgi:hypothetical protein